MLHDEATEEWYAQREPDEAEREERNCKRLARQFCQLMKEYRERFFTYILFQSPTAAAHLESYLLHMHYTSVLDDLYNGATKDQLELGWIIWQRDYAQNKTWGDRRTRIHEAMHVNCKF